MTPDKKQKLKDLQGKLKNLTPDQKQILIDRGMIATIEGRTLSLHNTLLCYVQSGDNLPTVVGGFKQWLAAGRVVKKGEHGLTIWFPAGKSDDAEDDDMRFYTATVFDIVQTEELTTKQPIQPVSQLIPIPTPSPKQSSSNEPEIMNGWRII
jgi:hypothetical protein